MPDLDKLIEFPRSRPNWMLTPAQHRLRAAELRAWNSASRAAELHELAARMKLATLVRDWVVALQNAHPNFPGSPQ
jgi:hypothetical protein